MKALSKEEFATVVALAHLYFDAEQMETKRAECNAILQYVDKLSQIDVTGVEPVFQITQDTHTPFSSDQVRPSFSPDHALQSAPERQDNYFKVPAVIEEQKPEEQKS